VRGALRLVDSSSVSLLNTSSSTTSDPYSKLSLESNMARLIDTVGCHHHHHDAACSLPHAPLCEPPPPPTSVAIPPSLPHPHHAAQKNHTNQIEANLRAGETMEAFRRTLLLVLLQDGAACGPGAPLTQPEIVSMEELLVARPRADEVSMVLSSALSLIRMLNSGAAVIAGDGDNILDFLQGGWLAKTHSTLLLFHLCSIPFTTQGSCVR
jgi:hypothetical protein